MNWVERRRPGLGRGRLLRRKEVAEMLGVAPNTISRWAREGRLPSVPTLGGHRRFKSQVIEELMQREAERSELPQAHDQDEES